ncbi:MAG: FmdB family zinc ribbon protein [Limnochordia bacterium]
MPLYEYQCPACRLKFEELCSSKERENMKCPQCGAKAELLISTFGFHSPGGKSSASGSCGSCSSGSCASCH